ncbi:MAG TPA: type VI secretion system protein TssA [Candidatus Angelobacter sp.]|nr:type VI secretion system protein TssA [Candidatus Angelobacter sp.]
MSTVSTAHHFEFDVSSLLSPVSQQSPAGELLRYEGTYDRIMEARREDDPTLEQGVWKRELKKADWNLVNQLCLEALQKKSKDLQIAAWLLESWIHLEGFSGLRAGCHVLVELCRTFWDSMYPSLEDPEYRLAPIHWINEKLLTQLKFIPITNPENPDNGVPYNLADWEAAFYGEEAKAHTEQKKDSKRITLEMVQQSAYLTTREFFLSVSEDVNDAYNSCKELESIFDAAFGKESCSLGQFRGVLESILSLIPSLEGEEQEHQEMQVENSFPQEYALEAVSHEAVAAPMLPPIRSRAEAYRRLAEAADYLVRTEPHSPAPYLIKRAISWGGMTLEQLLPELVSSDAALKDLERLLKIETVVKSNTRK